MDEAAKRRAAFAGTIEERLRDIYSYFRRLGVDAASAEDLAQETFLIAWQNIANLRDVRKLRSWLYGIAHNRFLQHRESTLSKPTVALSDDMLPAAEWIGSDDLLSAQAIRQAVLSLPPEYLHPIVLLYWEDLSYKEAAKVLSLPMGTFAWRVHRALKLLRSTLAEKGDENDCVSEKASQPQAADSINKG